MLNKFKNNLFLTIVSIVLIILGIYLIVADAVAIKNLVFILIGVILVTLSLSRLLDVKGVPSKQDKIQPLIIIGIGILLIFFSDLVDWVFIICGIYILIEPIVNIISSKDRKSQMTFEGSKILLGILLILLSFDTIYKLLFVFVGVISLIIGVFFVYSIINDKDLSGILGEKFKKEEKNDDDIIDVEG